MEMIIKCPDCGKDLKVTIDEVKREPEKIKLSQKVESLSTWEDLARNIKNGTGDVLVGDEISCVLKDGTPVTFVVAHLNPYGDNQAALVLKDCLPETHVMNEEWDNEGGWRDSDMRAYLKEKIYPLLPDDLKEVIQSRTILQQHNGEDLESEDEIWLLSKTEMFGGSCYADEKDVHFDLFANERSRVKMIGDETTWYWLRSPVSSSTTYFWHVFTHGNAINNGASTSRGVSFGFLI